MNSTRQRATRTITDPKALVYLCPPSIGEYFRSYHWEQKPFTSMSRG
ncbi:MAG: hypothetical protein U0T82_04225 [Bacteroidales bacterium]